MLPNELKVYLHEHNIQYDEIPHQQTFTAPETAQSTHIPGRHLAKVVMVKLDDKLAMTVLPSNKHIDLSMLQKVTRCDNVELAHEYEFNKEFPDCEVGAMPPFGDRYQMDVFLSDSLAQNDWLAFPCGSHTDVIKMSSKDFLTLVHPEILPES